jgi:hypothetical protein
VFVSSSVARRNSTWLRRSLGLAVNLFALRQLRDEDATLGLVE